MEGRKAEVVCVGDVSVAGVDVGRDDRVVLEHGRVWKWVGEGTCGAGESRL